MATPSTDAFTVSGSQSGSARGFHVIANRRKADTIVVSWTDENYRWRSFGCFDSVPSPTRAAGTLMHSGQPEFFIIGRCGQLHERSIVDVQTGAGWAPWTLIQLPGPRSSATDVATSLTHDGMTLVYVSDRSTVYVRNRTSAQDTAPFGSWRVVASGGGALVAAGTRGDGRQQVFTLDANGRPLTSIQSSTALDAPFAAWQDFDASAVPSLIDIESPTGDRTLEVFALDEDGRIWTRQQQGDGAFTSWARLSLPGQEHSFKMLSAGAIPSATDNPIALGGIEDGLVAGVYVRQRWNGVWQDDWQSIQ